MRYFFYKWKSKLGLLKSEFVKLLYYSIRYHKIVRALNYNCVIEVKPFNFRRWRIGCAYFYGVKNGEKVFIKVDTKLFLLKNEKIFYDLMYDVLAEYLLRFHFFHEEDGLQIACFSYAENGKDLTGQDVINNPKYIEKAVFILKEINNKSIIHRDIKLDNFIVTNGELKIIDFFYSYGLYGDNKGLAELDKVVSEHLKILRNLGGIYKPDEFIWNDFTSLANVVREVIDNNVLSSCQESYLQKVIVELTHLSKNANYSLEII